MSFHSLRESIPTSQYKTSRALREALDAVEGYLGLWPEDDRAEVARHALLAIIETRCPEFLPRHRKLFAVGQEAIKQSELFSPAAANIEA